MLAHLYHSKAIEIISGKDADSKLCSLHDTTVEKFYDRTIKGSYLSLEKNLKTTNIQCPSSAKDSLGVGQPYLVIQMLHQPNTSLSFEVVVIDASEMRRRMLFSTSFRRCESTALHAKIALSQRGFSKWANLVIDLKGLTDSFFSAKFLRLDSFCLRPQCRLRKVFSLPISPSEQAIPASLNYPVGVDFTTLVLSRNGEVEVLLLPGSKLSDIEGGSDLLAVQGHSIAPKGVESKANRVDNLERKQPTHRNEPKDNKKVAILDEVGEKKSHAKSSVPVLLPPNAEEKESKTVHKQVEKMPDKPVESVLEYDGDEPSKFSPEVRIRAVMEALRALEYDFVAEFGCQPY
jgi:hypothetical protein